MITVFHNVYQCVVVLSSPSKDMIPINDVTFAMLIKMKSKERNNTQNYYKILGLWTLQKIKHCVQPNVSFLTKWHYYGNS